MTTPSEIGSPEPEVAAGGAVPVRRLHPLTPVFASLGLGRMFLPQGAVAYGLGGLRLVVAFVVLNLVGQTIAWHRRAYSFDGEVLRIDSGVFSRSQELIPARRIQQVNLVEKLQHRVVGVATMKVETAGGGSGAAVSLEVVSIEEAHRLRDALLAAKGAVRSGKLVKGLGTGEVTVKLDVVAHAWSASAQQKIEAAGGSLPQA